MLPGSIKNIPLPQNLDHNRKEQEGDKKRNGCIEEYPDNNLLG